MLFNLQESFLFVLSSLRQLQPGYGNTFAQNIYVENCINMNKKSERILLFVVFVFIAGNVTAQGCSDAGFCSLNAIHSASDSTVKTNTIKAGANSGLGDFDVHVNGVTLEYNYKANHNLTIAVKTSWISQTGEITTQGLSDIYLNGLYKINSSILITAGFKIPFTDGNSKYRNMPLPMDYQVSLGTFDLIAGSVFTFNKFRITPALQLPLTQNHNTFSSENLPESSPFSAFPGTNEFKRSADVLLRLSYGFKLHKKWEITPSALPIYHISDDEFTDINGVKREIKGSQGLTLNANGVIKYIISKNQEMELSGGTPLIYRDARPDGLTRKYVFNLEYAVNF